MLPLQNLDDRTYEQIVEEARRMIPKIYPQWTDENVHDPGITLIELFAWLTEMQRYYLNRITENSERKFLKLIGVKPHPAEMARTDAYFSGASEPLLVPEGTKLLANELTFETAEPLWVVPAELDRVIVQTEAVSQDFTATNTQEGVPFYAFGAQPVPGDRMFFGFDRPLPPDLDLALTLHMHDPYSSAKSSPNNTGSVPPGWKPSAQVSWYYAAPGESEQEAEWKPLRIDRDETWHLSRSGRVYFRVPGQMHAVPVYPAVGKRRYWICCVLEQGRYELAPRVEHVGLNGVEAVHRDTLSKVFTFNGTGEAGSTFTVDHYLARTGVVRVQVQEADGKWRFWTEVSQPEMSQFIDELADGYIYHLERGDNGVVIRFGDGRSGRIPAEGSGNVRVIVQTASFEGDAIIGGSNSLPHQTFPLYGIARPQSMLLQVGHPLNGTDEYVWEDWQLVDDFDGSSGDAPHFVYDADAELIRFGDHEHGRIPPASGGANIRLLALERGGGAHGNIKRHLLNAVAGTDGKLSVLKVDNLRHASGGKDRESLEEAKKRVLDELRHPTRAVTSEDYEKICMVTPGVRVARVRALPLYSPDTRDDPHRKAHGQVTVVVVPYSETTTPIPTEAFLDTVKNHLERYRLITTELHVIAPQYVQITVHAVVVAESRDEYIRAEITRTLNELIRPLAGSEGEGWPFGRPVYKGDIYEAITRLQGVDYIQELWLDASGKGSRKTVGGDVEIPPHALVYSGSHEIHLVSRADM